VITFVNINICLPIIQGFLLKFVTTAQKTSGGLLLFAEKGLIAKGKPFEIKTTLEGQK
jgi:hypothetical protein